MREALFDILGPRIRGWRALDLFAGSGAVGIEALSRGAARVVFVERDRAALAALRVNLRALGVPRDRARVLGGDAASTLAVLATTEAPFDLVFLDPPYAGPWAARTLAALAKSPVMRRGTLVVVQHSVRVTIDPVSGLGPGRPPRRFGDTALTFLEAEGYTPPRSEAVVTAESIPQDLARVAEARPDRSSRAPSSP